VFTYNQIFDNKKNILFVTAHPDDVIVFFGALINKLTSESKNVYVVTVTNGARGSKDDFISEGKLAGRRIAEEAAALKFLKVPKKNIVCLNYKDGEVESDYKLIGEVSRYVRKYKADIVCTLEPGLIYTNTYNNDGYFVQHRDHRKVGEAVIDAAYPFSRDRSFFPEHMKEGIEPHSVFDILLTDEAGANFDFDYTADLETKKAALLLHKSQFDKQTVNDILDSLKFGGKYLEKFKYLRLLW
jgi:LmbE family N-acetylglucosaminyl deacetylase